MVVILNIDVIFKIGEFMKFSNRIAPITKQWFIYHLQRRQTTLSWRSKRLIFTYLKMWGSQTKWLTWKKFGKKQLQLTRRSRNQAGVLSWKAAVVRAMTWGTCQGCGQSTNANVFGTGLCSLCRGLPFKKNCYMITTAVAVRRAKSRGIPARVIVNMPYHRMGHCKLRFNTEVNQTIARFELGL